MTSPTPLFAQEVIALIQQAKQRAAVAVNSEITLLYWHIGQRINQEVLGGERADYGKQVVANLAKQLTEQFGKGWSAQQLRHCMKFAEVLTDQNIVSTLSRQLSWSHFLEVMYHRDPLAVQFYLKLCSVERWSVRALRKQVGAMLFERTAIAKQPDELIKHTLENADVVPLPRELVFKDPYLLDFLELDDRYIEKDLEDAILRDIEQFLLELGSGFTFIARQKRIQIDEDDFYIDLLFYNRRLKRLVAIELKTEKFKHAHKSQMELYLRWLAKYEQEPDELPPLGIILCSSKKQEQIELLEMDNSGIHVAEYLTELPSKDVFEQRLHLAIEKAKERHSIQALRLQNKKNQ
ncbi:PDDEXK nuclease domain-containing protein [Photobacterium sp. WH77]|uniref:PDDEXK nuclease domain-containing protein n=1 Tax=unclassified Photobacterium TaxID=2628852 RepID=UPI001EDAFA20|nr:MULTISPECIES: PDDEXK nuclease domain-containing protein [unclassified Photobacterium]MCG2835568.1 PDDEXK nuclease domain-containing protein [Photobacterium sp. WH77]MCG2843181.1 PDDEXK nuclease domain-containing protein [Photobacterium sp. WH80]